MSDIMPYSEDNQSDTSTTPENQTDDIIQSYFGLNGLGIFGGELIEKRDFPDRFGPDTTVNFNVWTKEDTLLYTNWTYSDSSKVINAFYNWIDCFGEKCKSIYIGEKVNMLKNATFILVGDTNIVRIEGRHVNFKNWYAFHDSIGYDPDWNYCIEQRYRSRAQWYQYLDGEKREIEVE